MSSPIPTGPPRKERQSSHPNPTTTTSVASAAALALPVLDGVSIYFRGYGPNRKDAFSVLCGDTPPTIVGGYAKWDTVDRPLRRGVSVFKGYDPVTMKISMRFGTWDGAGWDTSNSAGADVEADIERLEWMAGANFTAGQSPYVYVNTYNASKVTTNLIPYEYQTTLGVTGSTTDTGLWPWVINGGIEWGASWRARESTGALGNRIYQEATITLTNFQGLSKPSTKQVAGKYVDTTSTLNTILKIAAAQHPIDAQTVANAIKSSSKNNPIHGSKINLSAHILRWPIPVGKPVWVPTYSIGA